MVEATLAAVRRGVEVTLFIDLGFNDGVRLSTLQSESASMKLTNGF